MKVLVTGANGFIGRALCIRFSADGWTTMAAVRIRIGSVQDRIFHVVIGDITPDTDWRKALMEVEVVVHLAARVHIMKDITNDPLTAYRLVNAAGTLNLAEQAALRGVRRFVYLSSVKVNGENTVFNRPFTVNDAPNPSNAYAMSKWEAEQGLMSIAEASGMEVVIIRPPLVYGPGVKGNFASLVNWVCKRAPLPLGRLHNKRSLVALDNLVDFIALCANRDKSPQAANQTFLISDGEDVSTPELLRKVARAYGTKARLIPVPERWLCLAAKLSGKSAKADRLMGSLTVDISKSRELLGWNPVVTMDEQLQKMVNDVAFL